MDFVRVKAFTKVMGGKFIFQVLAEISAGIWAGRRPMEEKVLTASGVAAKAVETLNELLKLTAEEEK